ncbi:hypothetical protein AAE478_009926 [Parahypoxylon ruwenzoriense]
MGKVESKLVRPKSIEYAQVPTGPTTTADDEYEYDEQFGLVDAYDDLSYDDEESEPASCYKNRDSYKDNDSDSSQSMGGEPDRVPIPIPVPVPISGKP